MSKKALKSNSLNTTSGNMEFEQDNSDINEIAREFEQDNSDINEIARDFAQNKQMINATKSESSPVYLRDTLIQMDEFKKYGLNQYFLRAILTDNYYTLDKAHKLIQDFLNKH